MTSTNEEMFHEELVIILGKQLSKDGVMPTDLVDRLDAVINYIKTNPDTDILVSGKYALAYDVQGFTPAHYECDVMYDYLVSSGINPKLIQKECESKDTISNVKYVKLFLTANPNYKKLTIVCASHHMPRVKLLFDRYLDDSYSKEYLTVDANPTSEELETEKKEISRLTEYT